MNEKGYECKTCGKKIISTEEKSIECCGKTMIQIPLDQCKKPHDAEYSGPFEEDDPCDDGRKGIKE